MTRIYISIVIFTLAAFAAVSSQAQENRYGVIIANKEFDNFRDLSFASNDFAAAKTMFRDVFHIPERNLITLNGNVTLSKFKTVFGRTGQRIQNSKLYQKIKHKNAELYVYLITHGTPARSGTGKISSYFMLKDTEKDPVFLAETAYSQEDLYTQLKRVKSLLFPKGKITIFIESCFSGQSDSLDAAGAGSLVEGVSAPGISFPTISAPEDFRVITAAHSNQYAVWDREHKHSVFTRSAVMGLFGEADQSPKDGKITADEYKKYLYNVVARGAKRNKGISQTPELTGFRSDDVIISFRKEKSVWQKAYEWRQQEMSRAGTLLSGTNRLAILEFLDKCEFCSEKIKLIKRAEGLKFCEVERRTEQNLLDKKASASVIRKHLSQCRCCPLRDELVGHLPIDVPLQQFADNLNDKLGTCDLEGGWKLALWPPVSGGTSIPGIDTGRVLRDVRAFLNQSKPLCANYLGTDMVQIIAADIGVDANNIAEALRNASKPINVIIFSRFSSSQDGAPYLSLEAIGRDTGKMITRMNTPYRIPDSYAANTRVKTAMSFNKALEQAAESLVKQVRGMRRLIPGDIYYQDTGAQPPFSIDLMDRLMSEIARAYDNPLTGKKLKTDKMRKRSIDIESAGLNIGSFQLDGRYWVRRAVVHLEIALKGRAGKTAKWSGRIKRDEVTFLDLFPKKHDDDLPYTQTHGAFSFQLLTERGRNPVYQQGELLRLRTRMGANAWLYCFYTDAENETIQLLPNKKQSGRRDGYFVEKSILHKWPLIDRDGFRFRVSKKTAGEEIMRCIATDRNVTRELPPELRGLNFMPIPKLTVQRLSEIFSKIPNMRMTQASVTITVTKP